MMREVTLTINDTKVTVPEDYTILQAAKKAGIYIPTLCYDEAVEVYGACGLCYALLRLRACQSYYAHAQLKLATVW